MIQLIAILALLPTAQDASLPMRWRFAQEAGAEEPGRKEIRDRIDAWWKAFATKTDQLDALFDNKVKWDLPAWMDEHLQGIHPHLMWEFGSAVKGKGHRLVITPESARHLRPLVDEILRAAPSIPGWEFYGHRLPGPLKEAGGMVQARTGKKLTLTVFAAERGRYNRIDLAFSAPSIKTEDDGEKAFHPAFVAVEALAGEAMLDRWVGAIEVVPWADKPAKGAPLEDLKAALDREVAAIVASLPPEPLHRSAEDAWSLLEMEPPAKQADYPAQRDLFIGKSMNPELWKNGRSTIPFDSARWSRHGELFCFVKVDALPTDAKGFPDKGPIEDALDAALRKPGLGRFVGGGTGHRYSYFDLALPELPKAVPAIRAALQKAKVDRRAWILFYDSDLAWEWIGVWDDTPPPPRDPMP